jgi:hypothetical protein
MISLTEMSIENFKAERIKNLALNDALERASSIGRVVAFPTKKLLR